MIAATAEEAGGGVPRPPPPLSRGGPPPPPPPPPRRAPPAPSRASPVVAGAPPPPPPPACGAQTLGDLCERFLPTDLGPVLQPRPGDPLRRVEHLEAVAAAVAEPAVVDLGVVTGQHPFHLLVADGEADVALARADRADRAGVLDVPGPGAEAVGVVGQRPDRADVGDVALEGRHVGAVVEGADVGAVAALQQLQLRVFRDLLAEADAAVAEDAALAVDRDQRRELDRLLEVALFVDHPAFPRAPAVGDVLQRAFATLVADRAVERVVDEEELDHRALRVLDLLGARVDDHPLAHRGRAGGLQFRDPLDLDQAHAAGADRVAEFRFVTEVGDLDVTLASGVVEHLALDRRHLASVDRDRHLASGRGHAWAPIVCVCAPSVSGAPWTTAWGSRTSSGFSITASNSSRNLRTIAPTGIAIESPRTQRQWPMMFCWTEETMSRSSGVASPRTIRSSIFTVQLVPSRQGTHLPQDSWW